MTIDADRSELIRLMPKVELHVHLEGSIRAPTLLRLARRRGVDLPATDLEGLERWFEFRDFDHFVEVYLTVSRCLRDPEDFQLAARAFLEEQAEQNVVYTEAHLTISTHMANGANVDEVAQALAETVREGERDLGARLRWIPDIVRNVGIDRADQTLEWALANRDRFVVGLGLSGKERYSAGLFRDHFRTATESGLHRTVHAGEQTGARAVWDALEFCGAERIGHGIRSVEDAGLLVELERRRIPLEINPSSNLRLGFVSAVSDHPIRKIQGAGVPWSVGTDDPALFHTNLVRELELVVDLLGLEGAEIAGLSVNALDHAFMPPAERADLASTFATWFAHRGVPVPGSSG